MAYDYKKLMDGTIVIGAARCGDFYFDIIEPKEVLQTPPTTVLNLTSTASFDFSNWEKASDETEWNDMLSQLNTYATT